MSKKENELTRITDADLNASDLIRVVDGTTSRNIRVDDFILSLSTLGASIIADANPQNFLELPDTPADYTGLGGQYVTVNLVEDALEFTPNPNFLTDITSEFITNLADVNSAMLPNNGETLVFDGINNRWDSAAITSTFLGNTDTPVAYTSSGQFVVRVNGAENALEFVENTILNLSDTPAAYTAPGQVLTINGTNDGLEFTTPATGITLSVARLTNESPAATANSDINLANNWSTRVLNTLDDPSGLVPGGIASNQFIPIAGSYLLTYQVNITASGGGAGGVTYTSALRLFNVNQSSVVSVGDTSTVPVDAGDENLIQKILTVSFDANGTDAFRIDGYMNGVSTALYSWGQAHFIPAIGPNVFSTLTLMRIA